MPAARTAPSRRACRRPRHAATACPRSNSSQARTDRPRQAPLPRRRRQGAKAALPARARSAVGPRPRCTAWAARRRNAGRVRRPAGSPRPGRVVPPRATAAGTPSGDSWSFFLGLWGWRGCRRLFAIDHAVEGLAGPDHAQLVARTLLDRGLAGLEVGHFGRLCGIALVQAFVLPALLLHARVQHLDRLPAAFAV